MKKRLKNYVTAGLAVAACGGFSTSASAVEISQSFFNGSTGNRNYGVSFQLESTYFTEAQPLQSITFKKGRNGSTSQPTMFLNIYAIPATGTLQVGDVNFDPNEGFDISRLDFLGSSSSSVAATSGLPDVDFVWNFTRMTLPIETPLFAVMSTTAAAESSVGFSLASTRTTAGNLGDFNYVAGTPVYENITPAQSAPLFGGSASSDDLQDIFYTIVVGPESVFPTDGGIPVESTTFDDATGEFTVLFASATGQTYSVYGGGNLDEISTWEELTLSDLTGNGTDLSFSHTSGETRFFYQVREDMTEPNPEPNPDPDPR